jgi:hypothetical protein
MSCFYKILRIVHWVISNACPTQRHYTEVPINKLPWFWVGTSIADEVITVTEIVNRAVRYNDRITPQLLQEITGYKTTSWRYIDPATLEEKDFPPSGIVIENGA